MYVKERHRQELQNQGYTVIKNVVTEKQCDKWIDEYKVWLSQFKEDEWPFTAHSLLQRYNTGNFETTWKARLATQKVFSELWHTEKLLTSIDAIAIGRPPETSDEDFLRPGQHWLHCDQDAQRIGLHAYQGGLYLETADEDDWTFHVLKGSHAFIGEFYNINKKAAFRSSLNKYYHMKDENIEWFEAKGCKQARVAAPKGGMVLWDSRLIHANVRPVEGRNNPERWRFVVLSCMGPAIWASKKDIETKRGAYNSVAMTTHWPCQGVNMMKSQIPSFCRSDVTMPTEHCETAKSKTAKELCGVYSYNFKDEKSNGPNWTPEWGEELSVPNDKMANSKFQINRTYVAVFVLSLVVVFIAYRFTN
ncbi:uncharacterized protein LOC127719500 [Mytilus californianus]|uniref:uncharacterized protein LOC127719500 n=1 Tax=Mytilus californianus TaxID=6549 RepID=UPI00224865C4|nr:uncharacterized protein LOC127719500 [Mytilus californianus]XP_052081611.1 uncharacterized protein LOC127719500 [Mytilus californianus]